MHDNTLLKTPRPKYSDTTEKESVDLSSYKTLQDNKALITFNIVVIRSI